MKRKTTRITSRALIAMVAVVASLLMVSVPANAAVSTQGGYSGPGTSVQGQVDDGNDQQVAPVAQTGGGSGPDVQVAADTSSSTLPFTGLELFAILGIGGTMLALGIGLRRIARVSGSGGRSA